MLKKDITYKDLDDNDVTETFWFNLNKAEMAEMALGKEGKDGGFDLWLRTLINSKDGEVIIATFKKILLATIGERSEDNKRFIKSDEIRNNFLHSDAYSVLFMELITDAEKMSAFVNGIVPAAMRDEVAKQIEAGPDIAGFKGPETRVAEKNVTTDIRTPPVPVSEQKPRDDRPAWLKEGRVPTEAELKGATPQQIQEAFRLRSQSAGPVTQERVAE